jgi:hypothetical protein
LRELLINALFALHQCVNAIGIGLGVRQPDPADHARGQARVTCDLRPRLAAVGGLVHAAAGSAARHLVLDAIRLPQCGVDHIGIVGVDHDIDGAGARILEQRAFPRLAAVGALENAALLARAVIQPERRDIDDVGIGRVNADLRDRIDVLESDMRPRLPRVARFVDAIAWHDVAADARLAHADEDDVRIGFGNRHGADRGAVDLAVGDRRPVVAGIGGLPQAAADGAEVGLARASLDAGHRDRAAAAIGADAPPAIRVE